MRSGPPAIVLLLLAAACSRSGAATTPAVFAVATVGPAGAVLTVDTGAQAGLRIVVPAGALAQDVELRVVDVDVDAGGVAAGLLPTVPAAMPALPFRIEPVDLYFELPVTLRLPYQPARVQGTGPGNVRVLQTRSTGMLEHAPEAVDAVAGWVQVSLRTLGRFQVTSGPPTVSVDGYLGPREAVVALADGCSFTSELVPDGSPFAGPLAWQWRLQGPGLAETWLFDARQLRAREAAWWRETWQQPVLLWDESQFGVVVATTTTTQVATPIGLPPLGSIVAASQFWSYDLPRTVAGQLVTDVARFELRLAWDRHDLGTGQRQHTFWFAPAVGLLAMAIDGVVYERVAP